MTVEERMRPVMTFKPELASLNMGSMNFGLFPMLERFKNFEHEWEREHLENSRGLIFKNTYKDIETILRRGTDNGTRFEFERSEEHTSELQSLMRITYAVFRLKKQSEYYRPHAKTIQLSTSY